jgi:hypothetical protein
VDGRGRHAQHPAARRHRPELAEGRPGIIVRGYQSKDRLCRPACKANGRDVTFPDGTKLFMGSSGTGAPKDGSDPTEK